MSVRTMEVDEILLMRERDDLRRDNERLRAENEELRHELECAIAEQGDIVRECDARRPVLEHLDEVAKRVLRVGDDIAAARIEQLTKERDEAREVAGRLHRYENDSQDVKDDGFRAATEAIARWDAEKEGGS